MQNSCPKHGCSTLTDMQTVTEQRNNYCHACVSSYTNFLTWMYC